MPRHHQAYLFLLLTAVFWGANSVAGKLAVGHVPPMTLAVLRWGLACALLYAVGHRHIHDSWPTIRANLALLAGLGFFGFTIFSLAIYSALHHTTAINAAILQAGMPAIIFAASFFVYRLRVSFGQVAGFLISVAGVAVVVSEGIPRRLLALDVNYGDALVLLAVLSYAAYTVALRRKPEMHWIAFMAGLTGGAFVTGLPFVAYEVMAGEFFWPDPLGWAVIGFIVVFPSLLGQAMYVQGVALIGGNRAGLFINLVPIFGTLLSILVLGEAFHPYHALALVLVLGGIWMAERSGRRNSGG